MTIRADGTFAFANSGQSNFTLFPDGNAFLRGTLNQGSDRHSKKNFGDVDREQIWPKSSNSPFPPGPTKPRPTMYVTSVPCHRTFTDCSAWELTTRPFQLSIRLESHWRRFRVCTQDWNRRTRKLNRSMLSSKNPVVNWHRLKRKSLNNSIALMS